MIFEYCDGGEVEWKAADGGPALTLAQTRQIFRDTLLGLEYLHHQGIIHRDIKPSNLLKSGDKYKISDFGCSHFSEALLSASAVGGEEQYVDDIELAKTAGSPAFFAPEMCYSDIPEEQAKDAKDVPTFKVRPPSGTDEDRGRPGSFTVLSRDKELTPRPQAQRTFSAASVRKPRLPITNAIDVWALGVTLYCLLFGKTPFDAANEYLLMQEIPVAKYEIPATLSRDRLPTDGSNAEANEVLDLLSRLLEKDATKRISVDGAKHHPFTLWGLPDAEQWLTSTDPHAESYVTVTNEEVAAAVTRGGSIREKFRRGFNSISRRLGFGRHRSHSTTDTSDANGEHSGGSASGYDSATVTRRVASDNGNIPTQSNLARRLSMLSRNGSRAESPRPGLLASHLERERNTSPSTPIHHHEDAHLRLPGSSEATPRLMPSATSLDKYRSDSFRTDSPTRPPRRQSSDITGDLRPRTGSNASSSAGSVLALGRSIFRGESMSKRGSQRSVSGLRERGYTQSSEETDNNVFVGSFASSNGFPRAPSSEFLRGRSFDELGGRRQSTDTLEPSSPSSHSHSAFGHMSPERVAWPSNFRGGSDRGGMPGRRGSTLSEDIRPVMEDEEVDWDGGIPDSDDESSDGQDGLPKGHGLTSAPADWNLSECIEALERRERLRHSPVRTPARSLLRPSGGMDFSTLRTGSPIRAPPSAYSPLSSSVRARSPLTPVDPMGGIATAPHQPHTPGTATPAASPITPEAFADAPEDDDDGIVIAARGRRGSALSRGNSVARRPGVATPTPPMPPTASAVAQRLAS
jgi:[calcium/calmodulin-dependent protein kinase] kinase